MLVKVDNIVDLWKEDQPKYEELGKVVSTFIRNKITEFEILPEITYRTKDLISIIKKIQKKQKEKDYSFDSLNDKLGIRIICNFLEEMEKADKFLLQYFDIIKSEYKKDNLDFDKLDYISNHYDAKIKLENKEFSKIKHLNNLTFEIQVRTLNQHAWSNTAHILSYKQENGLPPKLKRRLYRLLSLYEIADDEFSALNQELKNIDNDSPIHILLKKIEGKFYKFAKISYDREISIKDLEILLNYFDNIEDRTALINNIEKFINDNETKIQRIYEDCSDDFYNNIFLTQPEIFVIWYMLKEHKHIIRESWDFDEDDFNLIKNLWGSTL